MNKFGMFIHWGIYALTELQEQAFIRYNIDRKEYEGLSAKFNPKKYNPEKWVKHAKKAGMEYICFTTKHHDGFCMWDTKYSDYNIMNTPYKKDVLKELADACHKYDMKLSFYYSNPDWHYEYGYNPNSTHQWLAVNKSSPDLEQYKTYIKNQITELLTNYGEIYSLFWDIPPAVEDKSLNELVRKLQPNIYINDRGWDKGDFSTPEREYQEQDKKYFTRMTEACNSFSEQSWGYRQDEDFYSIKHLLSSIDKMMAMGSSYLLNIGPDKDGVLQSKYLKRLKKVGAWYNKVKHSLTDVEPDNFDYSESKNDYVATKKGNTTYLHFYNGLISTSISLKNYPSIPKSVRLLDTGKPLNYKVEILPEFFNINTGFGEEFLHINGIDVDKYAGNPIIIEIVW